MAADSAPLLLVAGAGDVGSRLARLRAGRGDSVLALRRRETDSADGVRALRADLATGAGIDQVPRELQAVVFCAAPDQRDEAGYRALYRDGLRRLLDRVDAPCVLLVSSTAVYAEDAGEWVDEATPAAATAFNGRVLLEAERELDGHPGGVALRLSGIYGPGREAMLRKARAGDAGTPRWSNRIHVEDAVAALDFLLGLPRRERLYLGSDDEPVRESELLAWLRSTLGRPKLPLPAGPDRGRRVANARLRAAGWVPRHASFRSGYAAMLAGV